MASEMYNQLYKIILIGDSGVGKSNILSRFSRNEFSLDCKSTIGVEFTARTVEIGGNLVKAQVWDTAGQERYRAITAAYYRGAVGIIIVYDITKNNTFDNVQKWIKEIRENAPTDVVLLLVGNKLDLAHFRQVEIEQAKYFAEKNICLFTETSALNGEGVEGAFDLLISKIYENKKVETTMVDMDDGILLENIKLETGEKQSKCRC